MSNTGPIVVKIGGTGVESSRETPGLWAALRDLQHAERAAGRSGVVVVHGGGRAADTLLAKLGMETVRRNGLRVTPQEHLEIISGVLGGRINKSIVAALQACGQQAVGLWPGECSTARLRVHAPGGTDLGLVGEITGGDPSFIQSLLSAGIMPVFSPIGLDESGGMLNINADDVAASIAAIVSARVLVLLTDVPGLLGPNRQPVASASPDQIEAWIREGVITGGMVPKVRAALRAVSLANVPTVIRSWDDPETLPSIAEGNGLGTWLVPSAGSHSFSEHLS